MEKIRICISFAAVGLLLTSCTTSTPEKLGDPVTFLDSAASSPINEAALSKFNDVCRRDGNSSGINPHAKALAAIENESAAIISKKINARPDQIFFTSSATMANNIAILGIAYANPGCHIITSKIEHKSVTNVCKHLESQGYTVTYLDVDRLGRVDIDKLYKGIQKNTQLITIQMFNSEIGTLQNVKAIGEIAKKRGIPFHSDAAQAFCRYDINVDELNVDLLTISGHKIGTPTGVAALYARDVSKLQPILFGSGERLFPGTKPTALIAALAVAVEHFQFDKTKIEKNYNALVSALLKIKDVYINSSSPSHVVSVSIGGVLLKDLLERIKDYSFSAGCSCLGQGKSNVLEAIDPDGLLPVCTIRLSFTDRVDETVLVKFAQKLEEVVRELRKEKDIGAGCPSGEKGKAGYFGVLA